MLFLLLSLNITFVFILLHFMHVLYVLHVLKGKRMKLEVLLSCMNQKDTSIVKDSSITGDVLVINQIDHDAFLEEWNDTQHIRMISTTERGLSRSRNMAIRNAAGDICMLSDDDEQFVNGYEQIITETFRLLPDADVIAFDVQNKVTRLKPRVQRLKYLNCLKIASYQIAFRRSSVMQKQISFDPLMGAGSGNGCGEENKFLWDCLRNGLKIYYHPATIASVDSKSSTWFFGYDREFFYQRGGATRHMMGAVPSIFYGIYYLIRKRGLYSATISTGQAATELFRGIFENPIGRQMTEIRERENG